MDEDQFTKLFKYMQEEFAEVNKRLDGSATKNQVDGILSAVDAYAKKVDDYHQELLMLSHKVERLDRWIHEIADKTGVKLSRG